MRILHAPFNIANIPWELSRAQRALGFESDAVQYYSSWAQYKSDLNLKLEEYIVPCRTPRMAKFLLRAITRYDVFHFHFGHSLLPDFRDLPLLKLLGKKVFFHYHGCDIKDRGYLFKKDFYSACRTCNPIRCNTDIDTSKRMAAKYADAVFMGTPDLIEFFPGSHWVPPPLHFEEIEKETESIEAAPGNDNIRLVHAPSDPTLKGTEFVLKAVKELQNEGLPLELTLVQNMPWHEALKVFKSADIAVDQFRMGAYGHFAAECMALKKPVICYIRDDVKKYYPPDLPVIISTGDGLASTIRELARDRGRLKEIGNASYAYVRKYHDPEKIAAMTVDYYRGKSA